MKVDQKSINGLFKTPVQYEIPIYQRRYVWGEDNWQPLWSDIETNVKDPKRVHFTGAVVTRVISKAAGRIPVYEIIDGQQRLTTFQVILCAFKNLCESGNYVDQDQLAERADRHIRNSKSAVDGSTETIDGDSTRKLVYKLIPTGYDSEAFRTLVNLKKDETFGVAGDTEHTIHEAYVYFKDRIKAYVDNDYERMKNLLNSFINRFEVAQIDLEREERSQDIFLSINATGRRLSEFDYLRNYIFLRAGEKEEYERLYIDYWSKFEEDPWTVKKLDAFFPVFLMAKCGPEVIRKDTKLFDVYRDHCQEKLSTHERSPEGELIQLRLYAEAYEELDDPNSEIGSRMQFYKDLATYEEEGAYNSEIGFQHNRNIACVQSFILYLKNKRKIPDEALYTVFDILESYVARRLILDTIDSRYAYETIEIFFREVIEGKRKFTVRNLIDFLTTDGRRKWISNTVVETQFQESGKREEGSGRRFKGSLLFTERYIFYRIENWKRMKLGKTELAFEDFLSTRERMINSRDLPKSAWASLGNATFYTGENRSFINSFRQEKELLEDISNQTLILNQEICTYKKWGRREIEQREEDLLRCFYEIWPPAQEFMNRSGRHLPKSKTLEWISTIQSSSDRPFRFFTYTGPKVLSHLRVIQDEVQGIDSNSRDQLLKKSEILFVCSEGAWNDLLHHSVIHTAIQSRKLGPILETAKQLQVDDRIFQSVLIKGLSITVLTRLGREFHGTLVKFDDETICLQIEGREVIVFRSSLLETAAMELYSGTVKRWGTDDLFGSIECNTNEFLLGRDIEVKSQFIDRRIDSGKLQPDLKVKFNLKIIEKEGDSHFQADNVVPLTTWQLHQGRVKWFNPERGSGFLETDGSLTEIYVHKSQVKIKDINSLKDGQPVEFNIAETVEGQSSVAINVRVKRAKR